MYTNTNINTMGYHRRILFNNNNYKTKTKQFVAGVTLVTINVIINYAQTRIEYAHSGVGDFVFSVISNRLVWVVYIRTRY